MNQNDLFARVMGQHSSVKENNTAAVMEKLLGKQDDRERGVHMTVSELLDEIDHTLMATLYGREDGKLKHRGLFALCDERSLGELLSKFGDVSVINHDEYKNYIMVYLDD